MPVRRLLRALLGGALACAHVAGAVGVAAADEGATSRTDHRPSGDRVVGGQGPIEDVVDVDLGLPVAWVLPSPAAPGRGWIVVLEGGAVLEVAEGAGEVRAGRPLPAGVPPVASLAADGNVEVRSALEAARELEAGLGGGRAVAALPDARVVTAPDGTTVMLADPTARYGHAVLGDGIEAGAVAVARPDGSSTVITIEPPAVVEGTSPLLADLDADGVVEIIVTVSDPEAGARLRAYTLDGAVAGESDPIGRGFRWRHQVGVGPVGPAGEVELVAVRTPHIGGIVEAFRLADGRLSLVASIEGYSSHRLGSPNLDMALLADGDGDGRLDVIVPTRSMRALAILSRTDGGFEEVGRLGLDGVLSTNVAAVADPDGQLVLAVGTEDGQLRIFR